MGNAMIRPLRAAARAHLWRDLQEARSAADRFWAPTPLLGGLTSWYNLGYTTAMKTAISLPDSLFQEGEQLAQRLGISRSELYATALDAYVQGHRAEQVTQQLSALYAEEASALDEVALQLQALSLPQEVW